MPANLRIAGIDTPRKSDERLCEPLVPGQLAQEALRNVSKIHAACLKSAQAALSELLQIPVSMTFREATQAPFTKVFNNIGPQTHVIALDLAPLRGCGFLIFPTPLLFRILDILLATAEDTSAETTRDSSPRKVTDIELHILREFFDVFAHSMRATWAPYYPLEFNQIPADQKWEPHAAEYGDDPALNLVASVQLAGVTADICMVAPVFLARLAGLAETPVSRSAVPRPVRACILNSLGGGTVRLDAVQNGAGIQIRNLLDLLPGQILVIGNSDGTSVSCQVNSHPRFTGELIASNGRYALHIDTLIDAKMIDAKMIDAKMIDSKVTDAKTPLTPEGQFTGDRVTDM